MTLYLFKYCLPVLLGYTLFVGLSGRMNPLLKPEYAEERPSWFLGLWTGISVAIVMLVGLHMAYSMTLEGVRELVPPTALFMGVLLTPGFLVYFYYRRAIASELQASRALRASQEQLTAAASATQSGSDDLPSEFTRHDDDTAPRASDSLYNAQDTMKAEDTDAPNVTTFLDSADLQVLDTHKHEAANNDSALYETGYMAASDPAIEDYLDETIFEELHYSALELDDSTLADLSLMDEMSGLESDEFEALDTEHLLATHLVEESMEDSLTPLPEAKLVAEAAYEDDRLFEPATAELITDNASILTELELLASDLRSPGGSEPEKSASFLQMEDELSQSLDQRSTLETRVNQESAKRLELETTVAELQKGLIVSKQEVRRSTAARAKALSTANKAIAFARQTLQVRALLEEELDQVRETLTRRQDTISSLIKELEHEKERTQEEVSFMVQQLVLHEQQLKARRNLPDAVASFDTTLPARTPKRIETQSLSPDM